MLAVASPKRLDVACRRCRHRRKRRAGFGIEIFFGIAAPGQDCRPIWWRVCERDIADISKMPEVQERIKRVGLVPTYRDSKSFAALIGADHERFGKVIRDAGIKPN